MKTLKVSSDVHGDDVALLELARIRNAVDDHFIDGNARAGGEPAVVQEGRRSAVRHDEVVNRFVDMRSRNARSYHFPCQSTGCRGNFTGLTHDFQLTFIFDRDHTFAPIALRISSLAPSMD